jgi:HEAT repeat protein
VIAILVLMALQAHKAPLEKASPADGWTETRFHRIHLRNGNFVDGDLLRNELETITLRIKTGELEISRDLIERLELVRMRSYAEKPVEIAAPTPSKVAPEGTPPTAIVALPPPSGPLQRRVGEILEGARHIAADRKEDAVRQLAALGLEGGHALILMIESLDDDAGRLAGRALRELRSPLLKEPLAALLRSGRPLVRAEAVSTLALLGVEVDLTWDPSPVVRTASLWAAEVFKSRSMFDRATALCADASADVRHQAVRTSFLIAREHDLADSLRDALAAALRGDAPSAARVEILDALARLKNAAVWPAVAEELKRDDADVRIAAARCLSELKAIDADASLADAIKVETSGPAKVAFAETAGRLKTIVLVEPLIVRLSDPDPKVVRASADALSRITGQNHGADPARWTAAWDKLQGR